MTISSNQNPDEDTATHTNDEIAFVDIARTLQLLDLVPSIAEALRFANTRDLMQTELEPLTSLSVPEQVALLQSLGNMRGDEMQGALDVATAIEQLGTNHAIHNEAANAIAQLLAAGAKTALHVPNANESTSLQSQEPALISAWASRTRERGEVYVSTVWSSETSRTSVDAFLFLLSFWDGHIELVHTSAETSMKQILRDVMDPLHTQERFAWEQISLNQVRALLEHAIEQNSWRKSEDSQTWQDVRDVLVPRIIHDSVDAATAPDEALLDADLTDEETLVNFWGAWSFGDFALVYDLLNPNHAMREKVTRDEFIALRRKWYDEAHPARFQPGAIAPQTQEQSGALWIPTMSGVQSGNRKNYAIYWSLELLETPVAGQLAEMPMSTIANPDSTRHWYWQSVTMERDIKTNRWKIGRIRDEAQTAQVSKIDELLKRSEEKWGQAEAMANQMASTQSSSQETTLAILALAQEALTVGEVALQRLPMDRMAHRQFTERAQQIGLWERSAALIHRTLTRFPLEKNILLGELTSICFRQASALGERGDNAGVQRWMEITLTHARAAVETERSAEALIILAEVLVALGSDTEAEACLNESLNLRPTPQAWMDLGSILMRRNQADEAITAFRTAMKLDPHATQVQWQLGRALEMADRKDEAQELYAIAVQHDENDGMAHALYGNLLFEKRDFPEAAQHIAKALQLGVVSASLFMQLGAIYAEAGALNEARTLLNQAIQVDPSVANVVQSMLQQIEQATVQQPASQQGKQPDQKHSHSHDHKHNQKHKR